LSFLAEPSEDVSIGQSRWCPRDTKNLLEPHRISQQRIAGKTDE